MAKENRNLRLKSENTNLLDLRPILRHLVLVRHPERSRGRKCEAAAENSRYSAIKPRNGFSARFQTVHASSKQHLRIVSRCASPAQLMDVARRRAV